jgi:hypothetical protein
MRLNEVITETINLAGARETLERQVRLPLGSRNLWMEDPSPVRVRVEIAPVPPPPAPEVGAKPEEKKPTPKKRGG